MGIIGMKRRWFLDELSSVKWRVVKNGKDKIYRGIKWNKEGNKIINVRFCYNMSL